MKKALFINFSEELFAHPSLGGKDELCQWAKEPYCFPAKSQMMMEDWKAAHFAKHLTNRELIRNGQDNDTSPKFPEQNPRFMELFNKAYVEQGEPKSEEQIKDELINEVSSELPQIKEPVKKFCEHCDSKGVSHKKDCPVRNKTKEFEGL